MIIASAPKFFLFYFPYSFKVLFCFNEKFGLNKAAYFVCISGHENANSEETAKGINKFSS